mgnify:CR=1 FL=1
MSNKTLWIAKTGLGLALVIVAQYIGSVTGANQLVTGSLVNLVLLVVAATSLSSGLIVATVSPFIAFLFGIGPKLIYIIPAICIGNMIIVFIYNRALKLQGTKGGFASVAYPAAGVIVGAAIKALFLWFAVNKVIVPLIADIKPPMKANFATMFSWPQLFTALIGGAIAIAILPALKRAKIVKQD